MRKHLIVLTVFAGLFAVGPGHAQTEVNCPTAAQALSYSPHAGKVLDLRPTLVEMDSVNEIIQGSVGSCHICDADNIRVFYIEPGIYMLMASVQRCQVAHVLVNHAVLAKVAAIYARAHLGTL